MTLFRAFLFAVAAGALMVIVPATVFQGPAPVEPSAVATQTMKNGVSISDQVQLPAVGSIARAGFRTVIDLRPDGEAADQPPSTAIGTKVRNAGLEFAYIPTPHGDIPDAIVDDLTQALAAAHYPVLLYCRSGKRAARVWALAEASRPDGADAMDIAAAVRAAGQPVDDLMPRIEIRIAARATTARAGSRL
jgi:uncharacterized protein (TIGR01244 family)